MASRPTYESGAAKRGEPVPQTREQFLADLRNPVLQEIAADAFEAHRASIRQHEESRKDGR